MTLADSLHRYRYQICLTTTLILTVYAQVLPSMVAQWYADPNYSHGFLVPLIAAYFVFEKRHLLSPTESTPWTPGFAVVTLGLVQLIGGRLAGELFTQRSSLVIVLCGAVLYFFGIQLFREIKGPLLYLLFMVPLPYIVYDSIAFPLKMLVTRISVFTLKSGGIAVQQEGNILMFPNLNLEVADACSGIRSLMTLTALAVAYVFIIKTTSFRRVIIVLCTIPVAIVTNVVRVTVTGFLSERYGSAAAEGFFHEFAGIVVFVLGLVLIVTIGELLSRSGRGDGK